MENTNRKVPFAIAALLVAATLPTPHGHAAIIYSSAGPFGIDEADPGTNLPGFSLSRNNTASDTLYFKFSLTNLLTNQTNEPYFSGFNFYEGINERLGIGNALGAVAYSAYSSGLFGGSITDLRSSTPESGQVWQRVRLGDDPTIVFKVQFVPGTNDNVTVWLNPNLALPENAQPSSLTTNFAADASFDQVHLRESGGGAGWTFNNIAVATSSTDSGFFAIPEPSSALLLLSGTLFCFLRRSFRANERNG